MLLRPSSSYKWTRCAASPTFEERVPAEPDSDAAREGTCAAWLADCVLKGTAHNVSDMTGASHKNGWLVTPDMVYYVGQYVDLIRSFGGVTNTELFVRLTDEIAGTLDASTVALDHFILRVNDLKYGHKIVEIFENPQLIIYGASELKRLTALGHRIDKVILGIHQPRAYHPDGTFRTWEISTADLIQQANWIIMRGAECQKPNPVATPGPQCDHCGARGSCVALAHSVYKDHTVIESSRQGHLNAEELARELEFLEFAERRVKARKSAIDAEAKERIKRGEYLRGWTLKERFGHRAFFVDPIMVHALTGFSPTKQVMVTPAELERMGADPTKIEQVARRPKLERSLERLPDNHFAKVFKK